MKKRDRENYMLDFVDKSYRLYENLSEFLNKLGKRDKVELFDLKTRKEYKGYLRPYIVEGRKTDSLILVTKETKVRFNINKLLLGYCYFDEVKNKIDLTVESVRIEGNVK